MSTLSKNADTDLTNIFKNNECTRTFEIVATKHDAAMEHHAKINVTPILEKHKNFKTFDTGMTNDVENPFLPVSPDLETSCVETSCDCCGCGVIKIKCPHKICETKSTFENLNYLYDINGTVKLKSNHQYYTQIQTKLPLETDSLLVFLFTLSMVNTLKKQNLILLIETLGKKINCLLV